MAPVRIIRFTNGWVLRDEGLVHEDLWISAETGRIISPQSAFYSSHSKADQVIDLDNKIVAPGLIDVQLNGAFGFDFSVPDPNYSNKLTETNRKLIKSGVTSYVPTVTSQKPEVYQAVLPHLGCSGHDRDASKGSEQLGAHVEGPFLSPAKNGIHNTAVLKTAESFADIESCYGEDNLFNIRKLTAAPEKGSMIDVIPDITAHGIVFSIGHSDATFEQAQAAISNGATMVTHMFNAMRPFGHRDPGIFGLLGQSAPATPTGSPRTSRPGSPSSSPQSSPRGSRRTTPRSSLSISTTAIEYKSILPESKQPFFGLISDGIHLSPQAVNIAYHAHPEGCIIVTDAMKLAGCPDGTYDWTNGSKIVKKGPVLTLEENGRIAGSAVTLMECVNNFLKFTGAGVANTLKCVTSTPAKMLGKDVEQSKGKLNVGMDADLVVLSLEGEGVGTLKVDQVWKFGMRAA